MKIGKILGAIGKSALKIVTGNRVSLDERDRVDLNTGVDVLDLVVEEEANKVIDRRAKAKAQKRVNGKFAK